MWLRIAARMHARGHAAVSNDRGLVALWTALLMVVFLGMAAIAVDISRWYVEAERLQKTADAAALAGAPDLPGNMAAADAAARDIVAKNGWDPDRTVASVEEGARPTQLRVRLTSTVPNPFGVVLGNDSTTLTRTAVGEFTAPVPMGSPCNTFGNQDMPIDADEGGPWESANCSSTKYWAQINGQYTNKANGDAFASQWCTRPDDGVGIDGCTTAGTWNGGVPWTNAEYTDEGYVFIVRAEQSGPLQLQGYDIGWAATGGQCSSSGFGLNLRDDWPTNPWVQTETESKARYGETDRDGELAYCAGDGLYTYPGGTNGYDGLPEEAKTTRTVVTVRGPSGKPWDPLAGPLLCSLDLPGWDEDTPQSALDSNSADSDPLLQRTFKRWADLCPAPVNATAGQDYSIQVQTIGGSGPNKFGLRGQVSGSNEAVSIFADGRMSINTNKPAGTADFKIARLDSSAAGRTLVIRLFDVGDASDPLTVRIMQPDAAAVTGSALDSNDPWPTCTGTGPVAGDLPGCSVTTTYATNGGRWQTISIPVPSDYSCQSDEDQARCWVRINVTAPGAQRDITTWTATLEGDPVRLVESGTRPHRFVHMRIVLRCVEISSSCWRERLLRR